MEDEINSAAELLEVAELREVVVHRLVANREQEPDLEALGLPPERLHAPGLPDESADAEFLTSVGGLELGVRIAVQTRNAHAAFCVDVEAVFALPAPIASGRQDIVQEFAGQVGMAVVLPYLRTAVALLAAHLAVPASPLPLLQTVDMELVSNPVAPSSDDHDHDHLPPHPEEGEEDRYVHGKFMEKTVIEIDGVGGGTLERVERSAAFMIDTQTQQLVQVGDETLDVAEVDFIAEMLKSDPAVAWPHLRDEDESARETSYEPEPSAPDGVLVAGTVTRTGDDGSTEHLAEFFIDAETGSLIRVGGEGETPDADELLNAMAELAHNAASVDLSHADELTWQSVIRDCGVDAARQFIDEIRAKDGDSVADFALATMESARVSVEMVDAAEAVNSAITLMAAEMASTDRATDQPNPTALLAVAESVITEWKAFLRILASL